MCSCEFIACTHYWFLSAAYLMVYYFKFKSLVGENSPEQTIYMGKDKEENELLIKYGLPEDLWFHVSDLSSAHVYLRLKPGEDWLDIPKDVLEACCQLTKANSIKGNKKANLDIVYTPWSNLYKTEAMVAGEVGFKDDKLMKYCKVEKRDNHVINRLAKTRIEVNGEEPLRSLKQERDREEVNIQKKLAKDKIANEKKFQKQIEAERKRKETMYDDLFSSDKVDQAANDKGDVEDDFW